MKRSHKKKVEPAMGDFEAHKKRLQSVCANVDDELVKLGVGVSCDNLDWDHGLPRNCLDHVAYDKRVQMFEDNIVHYKALLAQSSEQLAAVELSIEQQLAPAIPSFDTNERTAQYLDSKQRAMQYLEQQREQLMKSVTMQRVNILRAKVCHQNFLETTASINGEQFFNVFEALIDKKLEALSEDYNLSRARAQEAMRAL
jgi:hypothetical protein